MKGTIRRAIGFSFTWIVCERKPVTKILRFHKLIPVWLYFPQLDVDVKLGLRIPKNEEYFSEKCENLIFDKI